MLLTKQSTSRSIPVQDNTQAEISDNYGIKESVAPKASAIKKTTLSDDIQKIQQEFEQSQNRL